MATPDVTPFPTPPSTSDPANFNTRADAFLGQFPAFVTEINALVAFLALSAQPVAITIPYTFSTTTTDSDPGAGVLRLGSATQNAATVIRADLANSSGQTVTATLDALDDSSSTVKGYLRLTAVGDGTKWLLFSVSAVASPSGYRNITVAPVDSSATNPFTNGDAISLTFVRTGDVGATGATGDVGPHAVYEEQRATSTGSSTPHVALTHNTVALNTEVLDTLGIFSLSGNDIVISAAGTYFLEGWVWGAGTNGFQANLYNVTDSVVIAPGLSAGASDYGSTITQAGISSVVAQFVIAGSKTIRLRAYTQGAGYTTAMGQPSASGLGEVYARLMITKKS
jgi:hypothetical protein